MRRDTTSKGKMMRTSRKPTQWIRLFVIVLLLGWHVSTALAQHAQIPVRVEAVQAVGLTVSDMDRSLAFYTRILPFVPIADHEVAGEAYDRLQGLFGVRMRVVRLRLG